MDIVEFVETLANNEGTITINATEKVIGINLFNEGTVDVEHSFNVEGYSRTLLPQSSRDYSVNEGQVMQGKIYFRFAGAGTNKLMITKSVLRGQLENC